MKAVAIACCVTLAACGGEAGEPESQPRALWCYPETLEAGDTLTIEMAIPHPLELAISDPNNNWLYLQFSDPDLPSNVPPDEFAQMSELTLAVSSAEATRWIDGSPSKHPIFEAAGRYTIHLAENLETDAENTLYFSQSVTYTAPPGPEQAPGL